MVKMLNCMMLYLNYSILITNYCQNYRKHQIKVVKIAIQNNLLILNYIIKNNLAYNLMIILILQKKKTIHFHQ